MFESSTRDISEQETADQVQKYAGKVREDTVSDLVDKEDKITSLFKKASALKKYWDDACEVFSLIRDRIGGVYTETPWPTIASLAGALLYVFSPIDCIPDFIPIAGFVDDASVFGFVIMSASSDLLKYRAWKAKHGREANENSRSSSKVAGPLATSASANNVLTEDIIDVEAEEPAVKAVRNHTQKKFPAKVSATAQKTKRTSRIR